MLPAELVEVRLVPGLDATTRSLGLESVLSAMAGSARSPGRCLLVAEAKLHRAWSYRLYQRVRGEQY